MAEKKAEGKKVSHFDLMEIEKLRALIKDAIYDISRRKSYFRENIAGVQKLIKELDQLEKEAGVKNPKAIDFELELKTLIEKRKKKKPLNETVELPTGKGKKKKPETATSMTA
jgi:ribosomal protein L1